MLVLGVKMIVSNLHHTVTEEDVMELFGDLGPLKRARMKENGDAEIVFVNKIDATRAVDAYHNRQLDGRPMKLQIVGA